jgi:hypothetical protein
MRAQLPGDAGTSCGRADIPPRFASASAMEFTGCALPCPTYNLIGYFIDSSDSAGANMPSLSIAPLSGFCVSGGANRLPLAISRGQHDGNFRETVRDDGAVAAPPCLDIARSPGNAVCGLAQ